MNTVRLQMSRHLFNYIRLVSNIHRIKTYLPYTMASTFTLETFTSELVDQYKKHQRSDVLCTTATATDDTVSKMNNTQLDNKFTELLSKNKDKQIEILLTECQNCDKYLSFVTLTKLYKHYSYNGKPDMVIILQNYCARVVPKSYKRNGEFLHYLATAQCMRGNSETGLSILKKSYKKYEALRSLYRLTLRDLIQDSVLNRSEASLVVFKNYVLEFSEEWSDHYPLVCFWHICWSSSWFSDQTLSNELLETSKVLQNIVKDKASELSIMVLNDYNEDAVMRLLQILLKYQMMSSYASVLQVLFSFKLRNSDIRGCTEIIRNCEVLGVQLPSYQQMKYLKMLIGGKKQAVELPTKPRLKDFKLKF